jgi:transposase InsO family protein
MNPKADKKFQRGLAVQRERREAERDVRTTAVACHRWLRGRGLSLAKAAERVGVAPRTLAHWDYRWKHDRLALRGRGRPCRRSDRTCRNAAIEVMTMAGPSIGLPSLRACFPSMARGEIVNLQRRFRRSYCKRERQLLRRLHWQQPGTVWAIDHAEPPQLIDGRYEYLLAVRDLASHCQLGWLPVPAATAETTCAALKALFVEHGPPLVIKSDNGSPFIADETTTLLASHDVVHLLSPPYTPQYNGACEAGIGGLKTRTHEQAALAGRPGHWTADDVEAARCLGNELHRPFGPMAATPAEVWRARRPITTTERAAFITALARHRDSILQDSGYTIDEEASQATRASSERTAISRTLVECGLLKFTGRSVAPPLNI